MRQGEREENPIRNLPLSLLAVLFSAAKNYLTLKFHTWMRGWPNTVVVAAVPALQRLYRLHRHSDSTVSAAAEVVGAEVECPPAPLKTLTWVPTWAARRAQPKPISNSLSVCAALCHSSPRTGDTGKELDLPGMRGPSARTAVPRPPVVLVM